MNAPPEHVAIVGCGYAGTSALMQLLTRYPVKKVTVYERRGDFGPGYAYQPDECRSYLLNNPTAAMGVLPGHRDAFVRWLAASGTDGASEVHGHAPRAAFGDFLRDVVHSARTLATLKGVELELVAEDVIDVRELDRGGVEVRTGTRTRRADLALLTTGRCPDVDPLAPPAGAGVGYFATHVARPELDALPLDARIDVLGASLSAYDVVGRLFAGSTGCRFVRDAAGELELEPGPNARRVVLWSRSGRLKKMQSARPQPIRRTRLTGPVIEALVGDHALGWPALARLVDEEAGAHGCVLDWARIRDPYRSCDTDDAVNARAAELLAADLDDARRPGGNFLVDLADDAQMLAWDLFAARALDPEHERAFRREMESAFLTWASPCPLETGERVLALMRAGRVVVRKGVRSVGLRADGNAFEIDYEHGRDAATVLVNATNPLDRAVDSARQDALVRALHARGTLKPYCIGGRPYAGADVDLRTFRPNGARSIYLANMWLWGPGIHTSSAFLLANLVQRILAVAYGEAAA